MAKSSDKTSQLQPEAEPKAIANIRLDFTAVKSDIIASLREDISTIIKEELRSALAADFNALKKEIKEVKTEMGK